MRLSVVIAAWNGSAALRECLKSLVPQLERTEHEVIVVSNFDTADVHDLLKSRIQIRLVQMARDTDVPKLSAHGIELAEREIVALLEDHCTVDRHWSAEIWKGHNLPYSIVGGSVENQSRQRLSWAVYFYDYGKYMLPDVQRIVSSLSGNNVSYKKHVLQEVRDEYRDGFNETFINQELQERSYDLYLMPSAVVYHNKTYELKAAVTDSYHHGRLFASRRVARLPFTSRGFRGLISVVLPVLLPGRIVLRTLRKGRHVAELITCFPYLFLLTTAWSYGELCGYFLGEGASAGKWK